MILEDEECLCEHEEQAEDSMNYEVSPVALHSLVCLHELQESEPVQNNATHSKYCSKLHN